MSSIFGTKLEHFWNVFSGTHPAFKDRLSAPFLPAQNLTNKNFRFPKFFPQKILTFSCSLRCRKRTDTELVRARWCVPRTCRTTNNPVSCSQRIVKHPSTPRATVTKRGNPKSKSRGLFKPLSQKIPTNYLIVSSNSDTVEL